MVAIRTAILSCVIENFETFWSQNLTVDDLRWIWHHDYKHIMALHAQAIIWFACHVGWGWWGWWVDGVDGLMWLMGWWGWWVGVDYIFLSVPIWQHCCQLQTSVGMIKQLFISLSFLAELMTMTYIDYPIKFEWILLATLTFNFSRSICYLLCIRKNWSDCYGNKFID